MLTLTTAQVARRYNISTRTIRRIRQMDPGFPRPISALSCKTRHLYDAAQVHAWYEASLSKDLFNS